MQALRLLRNERFVLVAPRDVAAVVQIYQVRSELDALAGWQGGCAGLHQIRPKPHHAWPHSRGLRGHQRHDGSRCCFYMAVFAASGSPLIAQTASAFDDIARQRIHRNPVDERLPRVGIQKINRLVQEEW